MNIPKVVAATDEIIDRNWTVQSSALGHTPEGTSDVSITVS
jgi:hypothetical protein